MLEDKGRVFIQKKGDKNIRTMIYIPLSVARDSQFPFELKNQNIKVTIENGKLTLSKT